MVSNKLLTTFLINGRLVIIILTPWRCWNSDVSIKASILYKRTFSENDICHHAVMSQMTLAATDYVRYSTFKRLKKPSMSSEAWQQCDGKCQCQMRE
nr:unnamed protein product [Callosobruchus chinensis]